jgi:5-methyltetrahydrofolate--homocysteine methyltransferase
MNIDKFITIGENIHCTRSVKCKGIRTAELHGGGEGLKFKYDDNDLILPVPPDWNKTSPAYDKGQIRHIALAIHQALNGKTDEIRILAEKYLFRAAERQIESGTTYLDVNVDEYSNDITERIEIMEWLCRLLSKYKTPLSIDTSNYDTLAAGLKNCRKDTTPMINSVSLERDDALDLITEFKTEAVVSAAGKEGLPSSIEEKIINFTEIIKKLDNAGIEREKMHLDALVLPISVDSNNGKAFLESVTLAKEKFPGVNFNGGLSNISFGMPMRNLLNLAFTYLFIKAGGNGGIVDPIHLSVEKINSIKPENKAFKYALAALTGEDIFCAEYIQAYRMGELSSKN